MSDERHNPAHSRDPAHLCAVCGEKATVRYKASEAEQTWYCARHVPPPQMLTPEQHEQWEAYTAFIWFVRDHGRMPSLDDPAERAVLLRTISVAPGTPEFERECAKRQQLAKWTLDAPKRHARFNLIWHIGCLAVVAFGAMLVIAALAALVVAVVWIIRRHG